VFKIPRTIKIVKWLCLAAFHKAISFQTADQIINKIIQGLAFIYDATVSLNICVFILNILSNNVSNTNETTFSIFSLHSNIANMNKYLGIDYGEKRVGIAISDVDGKVAFPKIVLENNPELIKNIVDLCTESKVNVIVIGESKDYKGEDNKISPKIVSFKRELTSSIKLPIFLEPEFMSSMQVEKTFGKTDMLDASAAAIILQSFIDKQKSKNETKKLKINSEEPSLESREEISKSIARINYGDFEKVKMTVGKILSVEAISGSDKLYKLSVDFAEKEPRQIISGIAKYFTDANVLVGKKVVFVTNLEPRKLMGLESNGMILAAKSDDKLALMEVPEYIKEGTLLN